MILSSTFELREIYRNYGQESLDLDVLKDFQCNNFYRFFIYQLNFRC